MTEAVTKTLSDGGDYEIKIESIQTIDGQQYTGNKEYLFRILPMKGDLDKNGTITIMDIRLLLQKFVNLDSSTVFGDEELYIIDMNDDGILSIIDIRLLVQLFINL